MLRVFENGILRRISGPELKELTVRTHNFVVITSINIKTAVRVIYMVGNSAYRKLKRLLLR